MKKYTYRKLTKIETYKGEEPLAFIAKEFFSREHIVNGNMKVTAQLSNSSLIVREILSGSPEEGFLVLKEHSKNIILGADEIETVEAYKFLG